MKGRVSQYFDDYLAANSKPPYRTPGTFLTGKIRGRAADWGGRYVRSLVNSLERAVQAGLAEKVRSARGRVAYRPVQHQ